MPHYKVDPSRDIHVGMLGAGQKTRDPLLLEPTATATSKFKDTYSGSESEDATGVIVYLGVLTAIGFALSRRKPKG